jgi:hypothetical protein
MKRIREVRNDKQTDSRFAQALTLRLPFGTPTILKELLRAFPQAPEANGRLTPKTAPQPLPSTSFPVHSLFTESSYHSSSNALDLYSGGARFESRPSYQLSSLMSSWFSSVHPCKYRDSTSIRPRPLPSKLFPIHQSSAIRRNICGVMAEVDMSFFRVSGKFKSTVSLL